MSYGQATPYFPVRDLLRCYCHLEEGADTALSRLGDGAGADARPCLHDTLQRSWRCLDALPEDSPFCSSTPRSAASARSPRLKRRAAAPESGAPLLLVCEDLHWLDTETQALFDSLGESLPTARLLLLINYRPDYRHGWGRTYYTQVRLDPLPKVSAHTFLQVPRRRPVRCLTPLLIQRTEGNPLFLEKRADAGGDRRPGGRAGAYRVAHALPTLQIPATVQAVLAARIDRLPLEEKRLLQTAAGLGTEAPCPSSRPWRSCPQRRSAWASRISRTPSSCMRRACFPSWSIPKHALTQQVAYETLLQERRRVLHARIVEALEVLAGDR